MECGDAKATICARWFAPKKIKVTEAILRTKKKIIQEQQSKIHQQAGEKLDGNQKRNRSIRRDGQFQKTHTLVYKR